jgi:hypothetical protein
MLSHFLNFLIYLGLTTLVFALGLLDEGGDSRCLLLAEGGDAEVHVLGHLGVLGFLVVFGEETEQGGRVVLIKEGELLHHLCYIIINNLW